MAFVIGVLTFSAKQQLQLKCGSASTQFYKLPLIIVLFIWLIFLAWYLI